MKQVICIYFGAVTFVAVIFLISALSLGNYKTFTTADTRSRTDYSTAYRDTIRRDFDDLLLRYLSAETPDDQAAILDIIRNRAKTVPSNLVPFELNSILL